MSDDIQDRRFALTAIALFAAIVFLIGWDLVIDYDEGAGWRHVAVECLVLLVSAGGIGVLWDQLRQTRTDLAEALVEAAQWRRESRELIQGLGIAIENQFARWRLTKAEAEVGFLLLKGLSHKEIAGLRQTSERTVREQARGLYRKSGLSGRSSLSAFFLEDLLLPDGDKVEQ
jgi:DNA-binding CsgD family transcriptional regulator